MTYLKDSMKINYEKSEEKNSPEENTILPPQLFRNSLKLRFLRHEEHSNARVGSKLRFFPYEISPYLTEK